MITYKLISQVKRVNKRCLHQQAWHNFMSIPEVISINYAISSEHLTDKSEIMMAAKDYYETIYKLLK